MNSEKSSKKRKSTLPHILTPIVSLLIVALVAVAMLYLRLGERAAAEPEAPAPTLETPPVTLAAAPAAETPAPTPREPQQLYLDLFSYVGALDVVVCDEDGLAIPGYAFPLDISYQDGTAHRVYSDVNGHYYAEYISPGNYTVSMPELDGFLSAESASCTVVQKLDYVPIEDIGRFVEIGEASALEEEDGDGRPADDSPLEVEELIAPPREEDGVYYAYRYSVGKNGCLLRTDGTESDVYPVEENGNLAYGERRTTFYYDLDGRALQPGDIPEDAVLWTDYFTDERVEKVRLLLGGGETAEGYAITAVESEAPAQSVSRVGWVEENGRSYYYDAYGNPVSGLKNIDGRLCFLDSTGMKASALGIDVSYHNSSIDWNAVKAAGIDFAIIRVAGRTWEKGILFEDEDSYRQGKNGGFYLQGAKAAGLQVGVYVYSTAIDTNEAVEEASLALEIVRKSGVELDLPIFFDREFSYASPPGRADRLSMLRHAEIARAFCETVENAGYRAGVYSNEDFFNRALRLQDVSDYEIWFASYTTGFELPRYRGFAIWQFSESVRINGMPDTVDINVIF